MPARHGDLRPLALLSVAGIPVIPGPVDRTMATVVRAEAYGGPEVLSVTDEAVRAPGLGEVTIAVRATAVNPIDYKLYGGAFGTDPAKLPLPVGMELSGVVTAVGEGARGQDGPLATGDEVVAYPVQGAAASEVTVPADVVVPKPSGVSWEVAAGTVLAGATAVHALALTGVKAGQTLLVHGASGAVGVVSQALVEYESRKNKVTRSD